MDFRGCGVSEGYFLKSTRGHFGKTCSIAIIISGTLPPTDRLPRIFFETQPLSLAAHRREDTHLVPAVFVFKNWELLSFWNSQVGTVDEQIDAQACPN